MFHVKHFNKKTKAEHFIVEGGQNVFIVEWIIDVIFRSLVMLGSLVGSVIVAGAILGVLKNINSRYIQYSLGWEGILMTAWIGTPVHELGHAIMCLIFGHKIVEIKLFSRGDDTVLGYVNHAYNKKSIYHKIGNFFIGIGPIISGTMAIILLMWLLMPDQLSLIKSSMQTYSWSQLTSFKLLQDLYNLGNALFHSMFLSNLNNYATWQFWVFIVLAISISSHMALSTVDMKGAFSGLVTMYIIMLIINILSPMIPSFYSTKILSGLLIYNNYIIFALMIAIFCSICSTVISLALYGIKLVLAG